MIKYGISNIRDLIGHKIDLEMVQKNPICRLDKSWVRENVVVKDYYIHSLSSILFFIYYYIYITIFTSTLWIIHPLTILSQRRISPKTSSSSNKLSIAHEQMRTEKELVLVFSKMFLKGIGNIFLLSFEVFLT